MIYSPFDHVNLSAKIVIVGLTPGLQQARNALAAARSALNKGASVETAAAEAKVYASFSGPKRNNLIRLLDYIGIARILGVDSTA
jgi:UDP-N-acetylmuramyl pentapeptide synthase